MSWKDLPTWLRGGIIGAVIWLILYLSIFTGLGFLMIIFFMVITSWTGLYGNCDLEGCSALYNVIPIISLIEFFILGAVFWLIIEKINSK